MYTYCIKFDRNLLNNLGNGTSGWTDRHGLIMHSFSTFSEK